MVGTADLVGVLRDLELVSGKSGLGHRRSSLASSLFPGQLHLRFAEQVVLRRREICGGPSPEDPGSGARRRRDVDESPLGATDEPRAPVVDVSKLIVGSE